jgi:hypothetical protein
MSWQAALTLAVPASVAILGLLAAYATNLRLAQRAAKLERVNRQLSDFYGPLYALVNAADISWKAFRASHRPGGPFWGDPNNPVTESQAAAWRLWMSQVFMPLNRQMRDLVVNHAELLEEDHMPACLLTLCAHVAAYQAILSRWEAKDYSEHWSTVPFPRAGLVTYSRQGYEFVKNEQHRLLAARSVLTRPAQTDRA